MADLLLSTTTNDLDLSTNDLQLVTGSNEIAQHIRIRLKFFFAEWFLDQRLGIPYIQEILRKSPNQNIVREILVRAIESTPGVEKVLTMTFDLVAPTRRLTVDARIEITGDEVIDFSEELLI